MHFSGIRVSGLKTIDTYGARPDAGSCGGARFVMRRRTFPYAKLENQGERHALEPANGDLNRSLAKLNAFQGIERRVAKAEMVFAQAVPSPSVHHAFEHQACDVNATS
jgi:hypothetical protein